MTYGLISVSFLVFAMLVAVLAVVVAPDRAALLRRWWRPWFAALLALLLLTVVFDNVMIAAGLVRYSDANLSGVHIGLAPIEDFGYSVAAVVLLPALWLLLGRIGGAERGAERGGDAG